MLRSALLCALLLAGCATTGGAASTAFYPLDELAALSLPDDRAEVLARAPEVAPSKRNEQWKQVVERAAMATLDEVDAKDERTSLRALESAEALTAKFPFLRKSKDFAAHRAELGLRAFPHLTSAYRNDWQARLLEFARSDETTPHLAQRLIDEVLLKQLIPVTAFQLFELAFKRDGDAVCTNASLARMVVDLGLEGSEFKPAANCWAQLQGPLLDAVKASTTRTAKLKLCAAMAAHANEPAVKAACTLE